MYDRLLVATGRSARAMTHTPEHVEITNGAPQTTCAILSASEIRTTLPQSPASRESPFPPPAAGNHRTPAPRSAPIRSYVKLSCALRQTVSPRAQFPGPKPCAAHHTSAHQSWSSRETPNPSSSPYGRIRKESSTALLVGSSSSALRSKTRPTPPPPAPSRQNTHKSAGSYRPDSFQSR